MIVGAYSHALHGRVGATFRFAMYQSRWLRIRSVREVRIDREGWVKALLAYPIVE
jgi:hypothetical protein